VKAIRALLGFVVLVAACGERTVETISASPQCPLPPVESMPLGIAPLLVDDLEDGDTVGLRNGGLAGDWEIWDDGTLKPSFQSSNQCAAVGNFALHIRSPGQKDWGASASLFFAPPKGRPLPYDASVWNAISFYMALSPSDPTARNFRASVSTMETAWNGRCASCVDNFSRQVWVTNRWQRYVLRFDELKQQGWGKPQTTLKPNQLVQLHIALEKTFDVWIDQIQFERLDLTADAEAP
jgi:hypothetical protein